jgi:hypothetical protein
MRTGIRTVNGPTPALTAALGADPALVGTVNRCLATYQHGTGETLPVRLAAAYVAHFAHGPIIPVADPIRKLTRAGGAVS